MDIVGGPDLSRRGFLLGVASLPATQGLLSGCVAEPSDAETDLVFDLSPDESVVRVLRRFAPEDEQRLRGENKNPEALERLWRAWEIRVSAFGPSAFFDLEPITKLNNDAGALHALAIRDVSYAELTGATVIFRFYKLPQSGAMQWRVGMITDVWHSKKGGGKQYHVGAKEGQALSGMASGDPATRLSMTLTPARVNKTFDVVADGLIRCDSGVPTVAIDGALRWSVSGDLSAFGGKARLGELSFEWEPTSDSESTDAANENLFRAKAAVKTLMPIAVGSGSGVPLALHPDVSDKATRTFSLVGRTRNIAAFATGDAAKTAPQVAAVAWIETVAGTLVSEAEGSFAELPFHNGTISQTIGLSAPGAPLRTTMWGSVGRAPVEKSKTAREGNDDASVEGDQSFSEDAHTPEYEVLTRIGRIRYRPADFVPDTGAAPRSSSKGDIITEAGRMIATALRDQSAVPASEMLTRIGRIISAALGDRSGIIDSTVYALGDGRNSVLRRFSADLHLIGLDTALDDIPHSDLRFDPTTLRLSYADDDLLTEKLGSPFYEHPLNEPAAFVWLGPIANRLPVARIDLLRAALTARSDRDLADLTFRFADLTLDFTAADAGFTKFIRPRADQCRVLSTADGAVQDNRPVLSVEFAPQHVMEEAFFRLEPPPLPDAPTFLEQFPKNTDQGNPPEHMESVAAILAKLQGLASDDNERLKFREMVQGRKVLVESFIPAVNQQSDLSFKTFSEKFKKAAADAKLPEDYRVYIGPYGLDPDGMAIAREEQARVLTVALAAIPDMIDDQATERMKVLYPNGESPIQISPPIDVVEALRREKQIEGEIPLYRLWRDCWRDQVIRLHDSRLSLEWLMKNNRPLQVAGREGKPDDPFGADAKTKARELMIRRLSGNEEIENLAMARLSGPSFLAFRINCQPSAQDSHEANHLPATLPSNPAAPGGLGTSFGGIHFTFAALTDWSRHEPAVTRRAQRIYTPTPAGELPPVADRAADLDLNRILVFQGISERGQQSGAQRLREIQASMDETPSQFETHIELPSRVILSTAQDAIWRTKRELPFPNSKEADVATIATAGRLSEADELRETAEPLWTARLVTSDGLRVLKPGVRVVDSPDFRLGALSRAEFQSGSEIERVPGEAAPPRGPYAPWMLGRDEWDGGTQAQTCLPPAHGSPERTGLIKWICDQFDNRAKLPADSRYFRSSLDAYDRHELVLLSSAYGLPVLPAGNAAGGSQFKPSREFVLIDGTNEQGVYVPTTLDLKELTLTALGGSIDHDTIFVPPAPARYDISGKPMFDGLSIERWQHRTVLGRDIVATVVYSGYLFPFGHKASLVKITERIFHRTANQGVKAPLRQRMFIRISNPDKNYPAVGQPNEGRRWCSKTVKLLTKTTPDIVDPTMPTTGASPGDMPVDVNGRIRLTGQPGLAFWPKTSLSESGFVSFDLEIDGRVTSMPLVFVDKVAVQHEGAIGKLVEHYNGFSASTGNEDPRCIMKLGGQTLEFGPSKVSGDTILATDKIVVRAEGRYNGEGTSWAQNNEQYQNIEALESAGQPPFYPAVGAAHIRIEQVETMTGQTGRNVRVKYDGHYVRHGFADDRPDASSKAIENPAEVFLCIADTQPPRLGMGAKGDQAGALAQPNLIIAALGRKSGPLGAGKAAYSRNPWERPQTFPVDQPDTERLSAAELFSLAQHFAMGTTTLAPAVNTANQGDAKLTYEEFFTSDAKLLGVITLKQLIEFLDITGATESLPLLKEAVEFGTEALAKLQDGSNDALDQVRREILVPLRELTGRIREQWVELDWRLEEKQRGLGALQGPGQVAEPLSIRTIYPEVEAGMVALEKALDQAITSDDPVTALSHLAAVHEAGKRFARQLAAIASNPIERVEAEIRRRIEFFTADVIKVIDQAKSLFNGWAKALKQTLTEQAAELVNELLHQGVDALLAFLGLPLPLDIVNRATDTIRDTQAAAVLLNDVRPVLLQLDVGNIRQTARDQLKAVADGTATVEQAVTALLNAVYAEAMGRLETAKQKVEDSSLSTSSKEVAHAWIDAYGADLKRLRGPLALVATREIGQYSDSVEQMLAAKRRIENLLRIIKDAVNSPSEEDLRRRLLKFAVDWVGVDHGKLAKSAAETVAKALKPYVDNAAKRIEDFFGNNMPALPDKAAALCLSGQVLDAAKEFAGASNDPMFDFAAVVVVTKTADEKLEEISQAIAENKSLPAAVALAKQEILDACANLKASLEAFRMVFRDAVLLRYHAQLASTRLQDGLKAVENVLANQPDDLAAVEKAARAFAEELRRTIATEREVIASLVANIGKLINRLRRESEFIGIAALAGVLARALEGTDVEEAADDLKKFADNSEQQLARWLFRTVRWLSATMASLTDPGPNFAAQLRALAGELRQATDLSLLDPERTELAGKMDAVANTIASASSAVNELVAQVAKLDEAKKLDELLRSLRPVLKDNDLVTRITAIRNSAEDVTVAGGAFMARVHGLPGMLKSRADLLLEQAQQYANEALRNAIKAQVNALDERQSALLTKTEPWAKALIEKIYAIHTLLTGNRDDAYAQFASGAGRYMKIKEAIVVQPVTSDNKYNPFDGLRRENVLLEAIKNAAAPLSDENARQNLRTFFRNYADDKAALQMIARQIRGATRDLERGDILSLIDIGALREEIEERISELVPLKRTLNYRLDFAFKSLPANAIAEIFKPREGGRFMLDMTATIDLINLKATMRAQGRLDAFDIKLVGSYVDALTLSFEGAAFTMDGGGSAKFDVFYRDFAIGRDLDFVQKLQGWLKPDKDGNGFYIEPARGVPGIKAGYGISLPIITLGNVSFSNISLNTAVVLPFDGSEALFEVSLGRPISLFRIAASPYAGGGFLAVLANIEGVKGFEMSLAFGGGGAFQAGPLVGQGFIDTGIYIRTLRLSDGKRVTDLYGTFYAGGSASIWIFHFAASLYVRLSMSPAGDMEGLAIFTFSFSMGIVDYDYRCEMRHSRGKMGGGSTGSISRTGRNGGAGMTIEHDAHEGIDPIVTRSNPVADIEKYTRVRRRTKGLAQDADTFLSYFDLEIIKKAQP
jgi:hypothetical protein